MNTKILGHLFELMNTGIAFLDAKGTIQFSNRPFQRFCTEQVPQLFNCFPETIGLENLISQIAHGQQKAFTLENITVTGKKNTPVI